MWAYLLQIVSILMRINTSQYAFTLFRWGWAQMEWCRQSWWRCGQDKGATPISFLPGCASLSYQKKSSEVNVVPKNQTSQKDFTHSVLNVNEYHHWIFIWKNYFFRGGFDAKYRASFAKSNLDRPDLKSKLVGEPD